MNIYSPSPSRVPSKNSPHCQPVQVHQPTRRRHLGTGLLSLLVLSTLPVVVQAQFIYTTNNGAITITRYTGTGDDVTIPDTTNGLPVTSIGQYAFSSHTSLTNVTIPHGIVNIEDYAFSQCFGLASASIPNSLTNIGVGAFYSCISLATITIPSGVISIGDYAFSACMRLPSVTIPPGVIRIGDSAFSGCTSLTIVSVPSSVISIGNCAFSVAFGGIYGASGNNSLVTITVDPENLNYTSVDGVLFNKSQTTLLQYPAGKLGASYTISNSVTSIAGYAFYGSVSLTHITIPSSVTELGDQAFAECNNLTLVVLPNSVINIGNGAFFFCKSLTTVTIPDGVTSIGDYAFYGCASLTDITIPSSVTNIGSSAFVTSAWGGAYGFTGSSRLAAIMVDLENTNYGSAGGVLFNKNQTTIIQYPAGKAATDYTIPSTVTSIGDYAFYGCTSLTNITIPGTVTRIEDYAFSECTNLIRATIPDSVTNIGDAAFYKCKSLASVTILAGVTNIGHLAFYYCTSLTGLYFTGNAPSLDSSDAFDGATNATVYYLPGTTGWGPTFGGRPTALWVPYNYTTNSGTITITGYTGPGGTVAIPSTINDLPVTGIGTNAFYNCANLASIAIPDSVSTIEYQAFMFCFGLTSATIGNSVAAIGDYAFYGCTNLISVTLPSTVTNVGTLAFSGCFSLTNAVIGSGVARIGELAFSDCFSLGAIIVDALNPIFSSADGALFNLSRTTLITCPGGKAGSYTVPSSVTGIESYAFEACLSLTNIIISNSVTNIGDNAFNACSSLAAISVDPLNPDYCSASGVLFNKSQTALITCPGGKAGSYTVPNSVTSIAGDAFWGCYSLTGITIPNTVTSVGEGAFMFCSSLASIMIGNSVTNLGAWAFYNCASLASVTIPNGVTTIGSHDFYGCTSLTSVAIPNSITSIGTWAFSGCSSLANITIPGSVSSIGGNAFLECSSLTGVYFAGNAPTADSSMFPGVFAGDSGATIYYLPGTSGWGPTFAGRPTALWVPYNYTTNSGTITITGYFGPGGAVTIPSTINGLPVTSIGYRAFFSCASLTSVAIPNSVASIGYQAFSGCTNLASVTIPNSVTSIAYQAFFRCTCLTGVTIPNSVTTMGNNVFGGCASLTSVTIPNSLGGIADYMFDSCTSLTNVTIPDTLASIGQFAFYGCSSLVAVTIPDSVTSLGGSAFGYCQGLTRIHFLGNAPSINQYAFVGSNTATIYYVAGTAGWGPTFGGRPTVASYPPGPYTCTTNDATIRITGYTGPGGAVTIPGAINGLPVTSIGDLAFYRYSSLTNITIPVGVTNIGPFAFAGCVGLTALTIPDGVTTIGEAAFDNCVNLTNVLVPDSVTSIGGAAFYDCAGLTGITIGNSVASLGDYTFYGCSSLARVNFRGNAPSIGFEEFSGTASNATVYYLPGTAGWGPALGGLSAVLWNPPVPYTYAINNGTVTITRYTGSDSAATIPGAIDFLPVTSIGDAAFQNLSILASITISDSVTNIGAYAFEECNSLTSIAIPNSITSIGDCVFQYCRSLTNVTIGANITRISGNAFYSCVGLTSITIPDSVNSIGYDAFCLCSSLTNITVGASVTYLDLGAFAYCSGVSSIYFRGNAPVVADSSGSVFERDEGATIYYLTGTSGWGTWFYGLPCVMLNPPVSAGSLQVTITPAGAGAAGARWHVDGGIPQPSGATVSGLSVGNHTIRFSTVNPWTTPANQTVYVSANSTATATGICTEPVQYQLICRINADRTLTITGYTADLGGVVAIPSTINGRVVTGIGDWAFLNCTKLTNVTIPASVTSIGLPPFAGCTSLTAIAVDANNPVYSSVNGVLFDKTQTTLVEYPFGLGGSCVIPDSVTTIGYQAFNSCSTLTSVTFGTGVTRFQDWAFGNCLGLTSLYFRGNAPAESWSAFYGNHATVYYLPGTLAWGPSFSTLGTALWFLPNPLILNNGSSFGAPTNRFGFTISWATNLQVVVEACTNPANPIWLSVGTNTLTNGSSYFSDPQWTNYPARFYRLRSP